MEEYSFEEVMYDKEDQQAKVEMLGKKYKTSAARAEKQEKKKPAKYAEKKYLAKRRPKRHESKKVEPIVEVDEKPNMDPYVYFDMSSPEAVAKINER